jgi:hypothetical protein
MKSTLFVPFGFIAVLSGILLFSSCGKDGVSPCETVVNENGPAFIKVINNRSETIEIYLGNFIPFGAELRAGNCEIYGVPVKNRSIEISTLSGSKTKDVNVNAQAGQTTTITVGADFF